MATGRLRRPAALGLAFAIVGLAGACNLPAGSVAAPSDRKTAASSTASAAPRPASLAGGACLLLDYTAINAALGTQFSVAASADKSDSYTCVVQGPTASFPDLTLSITATDLANSDFGTDVQPKKSTAVKGLGKVGYEIEHAATARRGPTIEVGWLSGNERLIILTYAYAPSDAADPAMALTR